MNKISETPAHLVVSIELLFEPLDLFAVLLDLVRHAADFLLHLVLPERGIGGFGLNEGLEHVGYFAEERPDQGVVVGVGRLFDEVLLHRLGVFIDGGD
jgi:hypothetical protein